MKDTHTNTRVRALKYLMKCIVKYRTTCFFSWFDYRDSRVPFWFVFYFYMYCIGNKKFKKKNSFSSAQLLFDFWHHLAVNLTTGSSWEKWKNVPWLGYDVPSPSELPKQLIEIMQFWAEKNDFRKHRETPPRSGEAVAIIYWQRSMLLHI